MQGLSLEELDGEPLLYDPAATRTIRLNDSAALVWRLCDGRRSVREIIDALGEACPEQAHDIEQDVADVLSRLVDRRAIEWR